MLRNLFCLEDSQKCDIYVNLMNVGRKLEEKGIFVLVGDFNCHCGNIAEIVIDQHGDYVYVIRNKEVKTLLKFGAAMNMVRGNTLLKKGQVI